MVRTLFFLLCAILPGMAGATLQWMPLQVVPLEAEATSVRLAVNANSHGLVAWHRDGLPTIQTAIYNFVDKTWTSPQIIETLGDSASLLSLYFNEQGRAALLWFDIEANSLCLSSLNTLEEAWSSPSIITLSAPVKDIQPIFDSEGNISIVWTAWNGLEQIVQGIFFSEQQQTWSSISDLSPIGFNCQTPKIAMNSQGQGVVAWRAMLSKGNSTDQSLVQAVTFDRNQFHWSKPLYFGYDWIDTCLYRPDVAIDQANNIAIIWEKMRLDHREKRLQYVRFLAKKNQWSYVSELEAGTTQPQLGKNPQNVQILWKANEGVNKGLNLAQFDIENNLLFAVQNLSNGDRDVKDVKIAGDRLGKLNLAWLSNDSIQVVHYDKGWTPPIHLDRDIAVDSFDIATDSIGNVMLTALYNGRLLYSIGNYLLPPDFFEGRKVEVRYPSRKVVHGHLTWCHATSPNVMGYIIRRNGAVLAILPVHALQYTDYRCPIGHAHYELTIVNVDNIESLPVKRDL